MKPFFFGSSVSPLYGVYHQAEGNKAEKGGALLCYPFGQEYMRVHRAFRQIANLLAKNGYHVLRFDYRGTGDSGEDMENMLASDWLEDIDVAIDELKSMTNLKKISLIGLRMGALLANTVSSQRNDIEKLVVWDPIMSGVAYEEELYSELSRADSEAWNFIDEKKILHFNGFPLTQPLRESLKKLDMMKEESEADRVLQVVSSENSNSRKLRKHCEKGREKKEFEYSHSESPSDWNYVDDFGGILLPQPVIKTIVEWLSEKTAL